MVAEVFDLVVIVAVICFLLGALVCGVKQYRSHDRDFVRFVSLTLTYTLRFSIIVAVAIVIVAVGYLFI